MMNTWDDVGGSDVWLLTRFTLRSHYHVWHCTQKKNDIWSPNDRWSYIGIFHWVSYGVSNAAVAKGKAAPKTAAAKRKATPKGKATPKAKGNAKGKTRVHRQAKPKGK